jgi:predicted lipoprotein with Yx(FWY)xxD motif
MLKKISTILLLLIAVIALPVAAQEDGPLVGVGSNDTIPSFLVDADGMALYLFTPDDANCVDACLENWPPLTVESEDELTLAEGIPGTLGVYERDDETLQVTYNDAPLYRFIRDEEPGDTNGEGINAVWYVIEPALITVGRSSELGNLLVGPDGMTLYLFTPDDANCVDGCLENWPPLTVENEDDIAISYRLPGETGVFEREDGTLQVTYNDVPLYYFVNDEVPGDSNGQGLNDVWYVINTIGTRTDADLGTYLTGPNGFALYLFTPDDANCVDGCLENWPPLTTPVESAIALEDGLTGEIGFFDREGTLQVTYNDVPLYYFIRDEAPADVNGQGVNDVWFVVMPESETDLSDE